MDRKKGGLASAQTKKERGEVKSPAERKKKVETWERERERSERERESEWVFNEREMGCI
jgi:hypothetical protein